MGDGRLAGVERRGLYPAVEPFESGMLDGRMYWEVCGNPEGKPVVFLHGGPGGVTSANDRRFFDPEAYRIVLFDQRNTGWSLPHASEPEIDLSENTTQNLVGDIELLREALGIERWMVFGGSWGSTLALAYSEAHPDRVTEIIVRGIYLVQEADQPWCFAEGGVSRLYPDEWQRFVEYIPAAERSDLTAAYGRRLFDPDPAVHIPAAAVWTRWEDSTGTLLDPAGIEYSDDENVACARVENWYFGNDCFLDPGQLLRGVDRIRDIPGVIVNGRYDLLTPMDAAWQLHRAWPASELRIVQDAGHSTTEPGIVHELVEATDRFRPTV